MWIFIIVGSIIGLVVGAFFKVKNWISKIDYGVADGVSLEKVTAQGITVLLPIWIYNPSPFNLVFSNLDLKIYFNGFYVSNIKSPKTYMIASKRNSTYPLYVNIDPKATISLLAQQGQIINEKDWLEKVTVKVEGTVTAEIGVIRVNKLKIDLTDSLKYYVG